MNVRVVSRDQREVVDPGGCRQQAVNDRNWPHAIQAAPLIRHRRVDGQGALPKGGGDRKEPLVKSTRLDGIARPEPLQPLPNFP